MTIWSWSTVAADNDDADGSINYRERQLPGTLNDSGRALMARIAAFVDGLGGGGVTYGGVANAYTIANPAGHTWAAYAAGQIVMLEIPSGIPNTTGATVNVDGLGAKSILFPDGATMAAADLKAGGSYLLRYNGTAFHVIGGQSEVSAFTRGMLDNAGASDWRTDLGLGNLATVTASAFFLTLTDDADGAAFRTTIGAAATSHAHAISDVTGLQTALDAKLASDSYTAADVLTKIKTVDGTGSGLDADLLDGLNSTALAILANANFYAALQTFQQGIEVNSTNGIHINTTIPLVRFTDTSSASQSHRIAAENSAMAIHLDESDAQTGEYFRVMIGTASPFELFFSSATVIRYNGQPIWHAGNDGAGSGLDADTVDGQQASAFATAAQGLLAGTAVQPSTSPLLTSIQLGHASDTTVSRVLAGVAAVEGLPLARVASGAAANTGKISWGTASPGTLHEGEIYLRHA